MNYFPFNLANQENYLEWRKLKLANTPDYCQIDSHEVFVNIANVHSLKKQEISALLKACKNNNMVLYRLSNPNNNKKSVHQLAKTVGLQTLDNNLCADEDSLTSITQTSHKQQHNYIPYSNKRLSWHTDGYYNKPENQINGMLLHCNTPAKKGGETLLMDHEIAYLLLRDENPNYIKALMQNDALTIPANILKGEVIREAQTGPVFSLDQRGHLHMRYSARERNIEWKQDAHTLEAVAFLKSLWDESSINNSPYIFKHTLQAGEGVICNNVLHCRTAFVDFEDSTKKRLLYRGRYYDRINTEYEDKKCFH